MKKEIDKALEAMMGIPDEVENALDVLMKGFKTGKVKKIVMDKNGHKRTVWVNVGEKQKSSPKKQGKYNTHGKRHVEFHHEDSGVKYKQGDKVKFTVKGKEATGKFRHVNVNNHSPKGYAVIRGDDGKLYERSLGKINKHGTVEKPNQELSSDKIHIPKDTSKAVKGYLKETQKIYDLKDVLDEDRMSFQDSDGYPTYSKSDWSKMEKKLDKSLDKRESFMRGITREEYGEHVAEHEGFVSYEDAVEDAGGVVGDGESVLKNVRKQEEIIGKFLKDNWHEKVFEQDISLKTTTDSDGVTTHKFDVITENEWEAADASEFIASVLNKASVWFENVEIVEDDYEGGSYSFSTTGTKDVIEEIGKTLGSGAESIVFEKKSDPKRAYKIPYSLNAKEDLETLKELSKIKSPLIVKIFKVDNEKAEIERFTTKQVDDGRDKIMDLEFAIRDRDFNDKEWQNGGLKTTKEENDALSSEQMKTLTDLRQIIKILKPLADKKNQSFDLNYGNFAHNGKNLIIFDPFNFL